MTHTRRTPPETPGARMGSWVSALTEVAAEWSRAAQEAARIGGDAPWLDWSIEGPLVQEVRAAAICGDAAAVRIAAGRWRQAWLDYLAAHRAGIDVRRRAGAICDELDGRRPPLNASVHRMLDRGRAVRSTSHPESKSPEPERRPGPGESPTGASIGDPSMRLKKYLGSFLRKEDCPTPQLLTIRDVVEERFGHDDDAETKPVLYFAELEKGLVLNSGNILVLESVFGTDESDALRGQKVVLYVDPAVEYAGRRVGGLGLRAPRKQPATAPQQPAYAAPGPQPGYAPPPASYGPPRQPAPVSAPSAAPPAAAPAQDWPPQNAEEAF